MGVFTVSPVCQFYLCTVIMHEVDLMSLLQFALTDSLELAACDFFYRML